MKFSSNEVDLNTCLDAYNIDGVHPAADLFPYIKDIEFSELCESINAHGLEQDIIITHDNKLLDGRNRLKACYLTGQMPSFNRLSEDYASDYIGYVVRLNLQRRHLTASERAVIANEALVLYEEQAKERQRQYHGNQYDKKESGLVEKIPPVLNDKKLIEKIEQAQEEQQQEGKKARDQAASDFGVNPRYIQDAKKVKKEAPQVYEKVKSGEMSIPQAVKTVKQEAQKPKEYITLTQWEAEKMASVPLIESAKQFNRQSDTPDDSMGNIEWADWSWNPVTGCKHDCSYCYARDIANRFYPHGFEPTLHPDRLRAPYNTKMPKDADTNPSKRNVFANSMSDLYGRWVPQEWIDAVFKSMADNPQWNFLTLTKFPKRAAELVYPKNVWIGTSVDLQVRVKAAEEAFSRIECGVKWLSLEPMIEPLTFTRPDLFDWVVIGGASRSSGAPEWVPPAEWVIKTAYQFIEAGAKVYIKTNGRPREFPGFDREMTAPKKFFYLGVQK